MKVVTRFAPSPTGFLHLGGARTALFNWLFSKANNGQFLLRIEDTDLARSTPEAVQAIFDGLRWLGLNWDGDAIFQMSRVERHREIAEQLLNSGNAYKCYLSTQEIANLKNDNPHQKIKSPWRDGDLSPAFGINPVIRLRVDSAGSTTIRDQVIGEVTVSNSELDDMIIIRSDGTPTYMFAVVVDDYDMQVTHIIRGDDHFTNTFRQNQIIKTLNWPLPTYAHIPLINGSDGTKLSKRHGALGVGDYEKAGYLPEAMCNYLLRLGWSSGNNEILTKEKAIELFTLKNINAAPARFDIDKLNFLNAYYISNQSTDFLMKSLQIDNPIVSLRVEMAMPELKTRAQTLLELKELANLYATRKTPADHKSQEILSRCNVELLKELMQLFAELQDWTPLIIKEHCNEFASHKKHSKGDLMQILRATILGSFQSPGIYETITLLGQEEVIKRLTEVHDTLIDHE